MSESLASLDAFAGDLIATLDASSRQQLVKEVARYLKVSTRQRIAAQQNPDGTAYQPRKAPLREQPGRIRRQMFVKLRTDRFLKSRATADAAIVGFVAQVSRLARVHQEGLRDYVNRRTGRQTDYPKRELLGFTEADIAAIGEICVKHLATRA